MTRRKPTTIAPIGIDCPSCSAVATEACWTGSGDSFRYLKAPHAARIHDAKIMSERAAASAVKAREIVAARSKPTTTIADVLALVAQLPPEDRARVTIAGPRRAPGTPRKYTDEQIVEAVKGARNWKEAAERLGSTTVKYRAGKLGIWPVG